MINKIKQEECSHRELQDQRSSIATLISLNNTQNYSRWLIMDSTLARPIQSYMKAALMYSLDRNCTCSSHYNCPFSSRSLPAKSMWSKSSYPKHFSILTLNYQKVQERKGQTLQCMIYICMPLENKPRTTIINITICLDFFLLLKSAPFLYLNLSHVIALLTFPLLPP